MIIPFPDQAPPPEKTAKVSKPRKPKPDVTNIQGPPIDCDRQPWESVVLPCHSDHVRTFILKSLEETGFVDEDTLLRFRNFGAKKIAELKAAGLHIKPSVPHPYRQHTSADRMVCLKRQEAALIEQAEKTQKWLEECQREMAALMGK